MPLIAEVYLVVLIAWQITTLASISLLAGRRLDSWTLLIDFYDM